MSDNMNPSIKILVVDRENHELRRLFEIQFYSLKNKGFVIETPEAGLKQIKIERDNL